MVARLALTTLACLPCPALALQGSDPAHLPRVQPITGPVRDAGVYHLATGMWTRKVSAVALGPDVIYNNTCSTGYYGSLSGDAFVDEGRVPGPSSPNNLQSKPGFQVGYSVSGFQVGYCTDQPSPGVITYRFFETYPACTSAVAITPTAAFAIAGLPGSIGSLAACWLVTIDLDSPPQTASLAFSLQADGDGTYSNGLLDLFGWSQESNLPDSNQMATGPIITGNFSTCTGFDGTRWDPVVNYAEPGTGMTTQNSFYIENGPTLPGCYWFGATFPGQASFHLRLFAPA